MVAFHLHDSLQNPVEGLGGVILHAELSQASGASDGAGAELHQRCRADGDGLLRAPAGLEEEQLVAALGELLIDAFGGATWGSRAC